MEPMAQINEIMIEQRNKECDGLDYNKQQANEDGNRNID